MTEIRLYLHLQEVVTMVFQELRPLAGWYLCLTLETANAGKSDRFVPRSSYEAGEAGMGHSSVFQIDCERSGAQDQRKLMRVNISSTSEHWHW